MSGDIKVVMDTNFLMIPSQFRIDIQGEIQRILDVKYEIFVPDRVLSELRSLEKHGKGRVKEAARLALKLAQGFKVIRIGAQDSDKAILSIVDRDTVVCTSDRELKKAVLSRGGKVIFLKQKRYLDIAGGELGLS